MALERADPTRQYQIQQVEEATGFNEALQSGVDVILCDYNLPQFSPYAALQQLIARRSTIPLVVVTRAIGEEAAVHVLRCGAKDYVTKDRLGTLPQIIERVMAERARALEQERLAKELEAAYQRLRRLSERLVVAQERERTLISRELHDVLGQSLTGMVIHLHAARRVTEPEEATRLNDTAMQLAQNVIDQIKTLSFSLRPAQLDLLGLVPAVQSAVQRVAEPAALEWQVTSRGREPKPLRETASVTVRLVQEALTNTIRHAKAVSVKVRLRFFPDGRISLLVVDDGVGYDKQAVLGKQPSTHNVGLYGMIERTELAGGRLNIRTRPGYGVAIRAVL